MGIVALNASSMGRASMGDTSVSNVKMATSALDGRHLWWIAVGVMAMLALVFIQSRVQMGFAFFVCVAGRT